LEKIYLKHGKLNTKSMINLKVGDKVTSTKYPDRVFNLAWYQNGDNTCAIEDGHLRAVVKVSTLDLVTQE
jgi:hypothetical protein